jgi:hypothetical protein
MEPHSIQILSILRFIGCDDEKSYFKLIKEKIKSFFVSVDKL